MSYLAVDQVQPTLAEGLLVRLRLRCVVEGAQARHQVRGILNTGIGGRKVSGGTLEQQAVDWQVNLWGCGALATLAAQQPPTAAQKS